MTIEIKDWGSGFPIKKALEAQDEYWAERVYGKPASPSQGGTPDRLIFVEHEPVYTAGASLAYFPSPSRIRENFKVDLWMLPCPIIFTRRGGLITYQGPGILSVYCVFKVRDFVNIYLISLLEDVAEAVLQKQGVKTLRKDKVRGIFVCENKKIASVGMSTSRGVSRYGLAISLDPEPRYTEPLIPCGLKDTRLTSLAEEFGQEKISADIRTDVKQSLASEIIERWK